jgi:hypothetical protein
MRLTISEVVDKYNPFDDSGRIASPSPARPSHPGESSSPLAPPPLTMAMDEPPRSAPRNSDETTGGDVDMHDAEDILEIVGENAAASTDLSAGLTGAVTAKPRNTAEPPLMTVTREPSHLAPRNSDETTGIDVDMQDAGDGLEIVGENASASIDLPARLSGALSDATAMPRNTQTAEPPLAQVPEVILPPIKYINGMPQYEWDKLQNIERNKKLLQALDMEGAVEGVFGKEVGKGKENKPTSGKRASRQPTSTKGKKRVTRAGVKATVAKYVSLRHTDNILLICPNSVARAEPPAPTAAAESHKTPAVEDGRSQNDNDANGKMANSPRRATSPGAIPPPGTITTTATLPAAAQSPGMLADSSQSTISQPPDPSIVPSGTSSTPSAAAVVPAWIAEACQRFEKVFSLPNQKVIVGLWLEYEMLLGYPSDGRKNRLTTESRPQQISDWMQRRRLWEKAPPMDKAAEFGALWRGWWRVMQPEWRTMDDNWPLVRNGPPNESWENLMKGGGQRFCDSSFEPFLVDDEGAGRIGRYYRVIVGI